MSILIKIRPAGAKLCYAAGQTDITNLIVAFRNFATAPKNETGIPVLNHRLMNFRCCRTRELVSPFPKQSSNAGRCYWIYSTKY
jgi:hypothetical protein